MLFLLIICYANFSAGPEWLSSSRRRREDEQQRGCSAQLEMDALAYMEAGSDRQ